MVDFNNVKNKKWFIGVGFISVIVGLLVINWPVIASIDITRIIGYFFVAIGLVQFYHTCNIIKIKSNVWYVVESIIYIIGGLFIVFKPMLGLIDITLVILFLMMFSGVLRVLWAISNSQIIKNVSWLILNGVISIVISIYFLNLLSNPEYSSILLGILVGVSLILNGVTFVMIGLKYKV